MTLRRALLVIVMLSCSSLTTLTAQHGPDPFAATVGGVWTGTGWVPKDNPAASRYVQPAPAQVVPEASPETAEVCDYISPYTDRPGCVIGDYRIGKVYQFGLSKGLVIGLSMASTGAEVVTVQYVYDLPDAPLQFWAFVNDGSQRPWEWRR